METFIVSDDEQLTKAIFTIEADVKHIKSKQSELETKMLAIGAVAQTTSNTTERIEGNSRLRHEKALSGIALVGATVDNVEMKVNTHDEKDDAIHELIFKKFEKMADARISNWDIGKIAALVAAIGGLIAAVVKSQ